jgi:acylphosphatase
VSDSIVARLFIISGSVQGVGYRYFARSAAQQLGVSGYAKNLRDGRVEVYAVGPEEAVAALRAELERGPRFACVAGIEELDRGVDSRYADRFTIERDAW